MAQETVMAPNDYSCFIHIHNETSVDFGLFDSSAEHGQWAISSPPNTIEANTEAIITLNDKKGPIHTLSSCSKVNKIVAAVTNQ